MAPLATRLRGLYLAIVTLGLVFIGEHIFREWSSLTGGAGVGREGAVPELFGYEFNRDSDTFTSEQNFYLLMLVLLLVFALGARNLARSRVGRAFAAVRDRDMAAEMMGINLPLTKTVAFGISSFYAGCAGALIYSVIGYFEPSTFSLLLSVQFIAMVLIGGAGTVSGTIMGALFISLLPTLTRELPAYVPVHLGAGHRHPQRLPARVDPLRAAHRRVPAVRTPRALRHLGPHPQLLEGLAVQLLTGRR